MTPIVTPGEMAAVDDAADVPIDVLIERAGQSIARSAVRLLGGTYGRRVIVVAGEGNNGADGRVAARCLARLGVATTVVDAAPNLTLPAADLLIDAAYGTGLRSPYEWPSFVAGTPILAVDIVSGCDGLTGEAALPVSQALSTVTFGALKPGLLLSNGRSAHPQVEVVGLGLDVSRATAHLVSDSDVGFQLPVLPADRHKWQAGVWVIAGSPGMSGAPQLCASAALRSGAGYVRLSSLGVTAPPTPIEAVSIDLPTPADWPADSDRFGALVIGPGLGLSPDAQSLVSAVLTTTQRPVVVDGDALSVLATAGAFLTTKRTAPTVLTPHDGEFERLMGSRPEADRFAAVRRLAATYGCVALLKGPTTLVADPRGAVLAVNAGSALLSTAGTGDVLSGIVGALLAQGIGPLPAAAAAAHLHGRAAAMWSRGSSPTMGALPAGLLASDLPGQIPTAWSDICGL